MEHKVIVLVAVTVFGGFLSIADSGEMLSAAISRELTFLSWIGRDPNRDHPCEYASVDDAQEPVDT